MYKLFSNAYARMRFLRFNDIRPFLAKVLNVSLSFLMIVTLAFVTIETIDPEPALASTDFAWEAANRVFEQRKYYDVHVNIFTPASFFGILEKAIMHELVFFEICQRFEDLET